MTTDIDILRSALAIESKPTAPRIGLIGKWTHYSVGASREDMRRLLDDGMVIIFSRAGNEINYKLSDKGRSVAQSNQIAYEIPTSSAILDAMSLIVGFDDIKHTISMAIASRKRLNFLLQGEPASSKSLFLEAIRSSCEGSKMAFGSQISPSGLSDLLFEKQPSILLMDEVDKTHHDVLSVMLGLMETGEILITKTKKTKGIKLNTMVIAACNRSDKMPPEFLSRFALHARFPKYTRPEFIEVCQGFLTRSDNVPLDIATRIGELVYDEGIGDVRKARAAWNMMTEPTSDELQRVIQLMLTYSPDLSIQTKARQSRERRIASIPMGI